MCKQHGCKCWDYKDKLHKVLVVKERQKRKHLTHSWSWEHEAPSLLVDRKFKRQGDHVRIVINNTLILPTKGTWSKGYRTLPTSPIKWWGGESTGWRRKLDNLL